VTVPILFGIALACHGGWQGSSSQFISQAVSPLPLGATITRCRATHAEAACANMSERQTRGMARTEFIYKRVKRYDIPGHAHFITFSCYRRLPLLSNDVWRSWLCQSVRAACEERRVALWAYVFMPEHIHLLARPCREKYRISDFLYTMALVEFPLAGTGEDRRRTAGA